MPFVKGQSGNPAGRKKGSIELKTLLIAMLADKSAAEAKELVRNTLNDAKLTDGQSRKMVWDRIDGPVVQKNENTNTQRLYFIKGEDAASIGADVE